MPWEHLPGAGRDIGIGADGSVWVLGTDNVPGGHSIFRWDGHAWVHVEGAAKAIAVGPDGQPWVTNASGEIFHRQGSWRLLPGRANDIGVGADGSAWVLGTDNVAGGHSIFHWNGRDWDRVEGAAVRISVGPHGQPWVVNLQTNIFVRIGHVWRELPGNALDIGVGSGGDTWVIGTDATGDGAGIYRWLDHGDNPQWDRVEGAGWRIAVGPDGLAWVVSRSGGIFRWRVALD
jgi:hypothetical protein